MTIPRIVLEPIRVLSDRGLKSNEGGTFKKESWGLSAGSPIPERGRKMALPEEWVRKIQLKL